MPRPTNPVKRPSKRVRRMARFLHARLGSKHPDVRKRTDSAQLLIEAKELAGKGSFGSSMVDDELTRNIRYARRMNWSRMADFFDPSVYSKITGKRAVLAYKREAIALRKKVPVALYGRLRTIARKKIETLRRQLWIPERYEDIPRVKTELSKENILVGQEAMLGVNPVHSDLKKRGRKEKYYESPAEKAAGEISRAQGVTNWDHRNYNCRVLFTRESFNPLESGFENWGELKRNTTVLAVQLFDPNPKALLDFAKTMSKRRPNDPIVILDLFGNIFYP